MIQGKLNFPFQKVSSALELWILWSALDLWILWSAPDLLFLILAIRVWPGFFSGSLRDCPQKNSRFVLAQAQTNGTKIKAFGDLMGFGVTSGPGVPPGYKGSYKPKKPKHELKPQSSEMW